MDEWMLVINNWTARRRQAFGIPESKDPVTTEEKQECKRWIRDYGFQTVIRATWDVILKGRKHEGYRPRFKHIGMILERDYYALLDPRRPPETIPMDRREEVEKARQKGDRHGEIGSGS